MTLRTCFLTAALAALADAAHAQSADDWTPPRAGDWIINGRATSVSPVADDAILTSAGAATGLNVDVGDDVMPTLGFTYFVTDHVAVEAILGATRRRQHQWRRPAQRREPRPLGGVDRSRPALPTSVRESPGRRRRRPLSSIAPVW